MEKLMKRGVPNEVYIGDGVYVTYDGWQIWLRTTREEGDHQIALEPETYTALVQFVERLKEKAKERASEDK